MKKKLAITNLSLSMVLLAGAVITVFASNDGYELFKTALKNTHKVKEVNISF